MESLNTDKNTDELYEDAVKNGIEPRGSLKKTYNYIRENNKLPEHIYL